MTLDLKLFLSSFFLPFHLSDDLFLIYFGDISYLCSTVMETKKENILYQRKDKKNSGPCYQHFMHLLSVSGLLFSVSYG